MLYAIAAFAIFSVGLAALVASQRRAVLPHGAEEVIEAVTRNESVPELFSGATGSVTANGAVLWYERREPPDSSHGTVILVPGLGGDALFWPRWFVEGLLAAGYAVLRFDPRGTGLSSSLEKWRLKNAYSTGDMADDVVAVLDANGVARAHALGVSLGGIVVQQLAIRHGERLASMTVMMAPLVVEDDTLPQVAWGHPVKTLFSAGLPVLSFRLLGGEKNLIRERLAMLLQISETGEVDSRSVAETVVYALRNGRDFNMRSAWQHFVAVARGPYTYEEIAGVQTPALVIHGLDDEFVPCVHGQRLVEHLPNARGLWVAGAGHVFPFAHMKEPMTAIIDHLDRCSL